MSNMRKVFVVSKMGLEQLKIQICAHQMWKNENLQYCPILYFALFDQIIFISISQYMIAWLQYMIAWLQYMIAKDTNGSSSISNIKY